MANKHNFDELDEDILGIIAKFSIEHGYGACLRDVMRETGMASTSSMKYRLDWLIENGYLKPRPKGVNRAYVVNMDEKENRNEQATNK